MFIIYSELFEDGRWFFGMYDNEDVANEIAYDLGSDYCVTDIETARELNVMNLPR